MYLCDDFLIVMVIINDNDGDGINDEDVFPDDPNRLRFNGMGVGDNEDDFPNDPQR